jgi:gamma-glutamyltranspeptidase/glutathione hydrolase
VLLVAAATAFEPQPVLTAEGTVATVHPMGTDAGLDAFRRGGNAVDAAVAAALTLGVVDGRNAGIGGGCFILIHLADGQLVAIDGRETAPAAATHDMYLRGGKPQPELSLVGPLASGVPGALAAYERAVGQYGRLPLRDLLLPAAEIAEQGFPLQAVYAAALKSNSEKLARFEGSRAVLLKPDASPYEPRDTLKQPDLAGAYRAIAAEGTDWFYRGPFARRVGRWMSENGGILTAEDFAGYRVRVRKPVVSRYRQYTVVGFPPPSSGGVHVAEILNVLEHFDLKAVHARDPATFYHLVAEAMKLAFADRAHWLGDPDFSDVPRGLIDKQYAAELARRIAQDKVAEVTGHGRPPRWAEDHFGKHTTHVAAADRDGNWVAITATVNTAFGSKVIVPKTGVILNNQMDDFSVAPGVPNAFGLIGAEANEVAPGKRPLSSMSPTIVLEGDRPILTLGAAGGPKIITHVVMTIVCHLDLGLPLSEALAAPRLHHQWRPDRILVESSLDPAIVDALEGFGHEVQRAKSVGISQAIGVSPDAGKLIGLHDPRVAGKAAGL